MTRKMTRDQLLKGIREGLKRRERVSRWNSAMNRLVARAQRPEPLANREAACRLLDMVAEDRLTNAWQ
jgi:hypothetical protein